MTIVESATAVGTPERDSDERAAGVAMSSAKSMARCMAITMAPSSADCHIQICTAQSHPAHQPRPDPPYEHTSRLVHRCRGFRDNISLVQHRQVATTTCGSATVNRGAHCGTAEDRRLLPTVLGRARRDVTPRDCALRL